MLRCIPLIHVWIKTHPSLVFSPFSAPDLAGDRANDVAKEASLTFATASAGLEVYDGPSLWSLNSLLSITT